MLALIDHPRPAPGACMSTIDVRHAHALPDAQARAAIEQVAAKLSERFGLWLSFYPFKQDDYLDIVYHWLRELGCPEAHIEPSRTEALQWTIERGSRSGRVAYQFARDWAARHV
ncbi:hypothetical protein G6F60_014961 [Rhizopus arrhizus]|nr:hypothetical protein G6F60_014961 [Rhizopus arrhizus]